jgi:hypothetical protein
MAQENKEPDWAHRAQYIDHKPEWVDGIPHLLHQLGEVFFPIPAGRKGYPYPHHLDEYRYCATSETLNAYLECGWGYGVACANNLIVVDIDEKELAEEITDDLPETAYQISGSRTGVHLFYKSSGFNTRQILHYPTEKHDCDNSDHSCRTDKDGDCVKEHEWDHLGEVKADPHGYVVGPGSRHPSGNKYGPLRGDKIAEVDKEDLMERLDGYVKPQRGRASSPGSYDPEQTPEVSGYEFYQLGASDVMGFLSPNNRIDHPVHGSTSEAGNFMLNGDGETFTCWRHNFGGSQGCGINAQQFLAQSEAKQESNLGYIECDEIRRMWSTDYRLHFLGWRRAVRDGLIQVTSVPYKVILGYAKMNGWDVDEDNLSYKDYWDLRNAVQYDTLKMGAGALAH